MSTDRFFGGGGGGAPTYDFAKNSKKNCMKLQNVWIIKSEGAGLSPLDYHHDKQILQIRNFHCSNFIVFYDKHFCQTW